MSFKAKDLIYDNTQPTFLRRMRGELTANDSAANGQPAARNKRAKQDDDDDAPTYVLEDTNESVSKKEYDALVAGKDSDTAQATPANLPGDTSKKDKIAEVGKPSKKRKIGKVIAEDADEATPRPEDPDLEKPAKTGESKKGAKKAKKKTKAVKLTFGEEED